ncbi:hypothetical protein J4216_01420 [Candidatus Woesearchaeota archaeon]|nr:hypothetical protein [Candidatus Woesearchaeota archaeon]
MIGYFVGWALGKAFTWLLNKIGLDHAVSKSGFAKQMGHTHLPNLGGELVKWFVFIIFLQVAVNILNLNVLSSLLGDFVNWLPNVLVAIIVLFFGVALAHYIHMKIRETTKMRGMIVMGGVIKVVILYFALVISLRQIGINVNFLESTFLILLGALGLGFALALGIGLGLGVRSHAEEWIKKFKKNL